jgi:SAM-dependent methyltransferase
MKFLPISVALILVFQACEAFVPSKAFMGVAPLHSSPVKSSSSLKMADLDLVTYLRTEFIAAALVTNQTPRSADVLLQLGTQDGRVVSFVPKTVREIITSSAEADGIVTSTARRQLKLQADRRKAATVTYIDQPADDLRETADASVDVVLSMCAAARMADNGLDWKKSIQEAARVLKPGGRLLFVEETEIGGESYLEYVQTLTAITGETPEDEEERFLIFEEGGFDDVDLVLKPHIAGVAIKSEDAGMTAEERSGKGAKEEKDRQADLTLAAYERGIKKRRRKKKTVATEEDA